MKWVAASLMGLMMAALVAAQTATSAPSTDAHRVQVQAAASNAMANLREQILRVSLAKGVTVHDLLERTDGVDALSRVLRDAQQIGGPRWIDEHTCQVRLAISGPRVANVLISQASEYPQRCPLSLEALRQRLDDWDKLNFCAVGSSVGGESIETAPLHYDVGAWADVSTAQRRKAVHAAKHDAQRRVLDGIATIPLHGAVLVQDALARPEIADPVDQWINHQPVTKVEFLDDLRVSVTIAVSPDALASALQAAVSNDKSFATGEAIDWSRVRQEIAGRVGLAIGKASAAPVTATTAPAVTLPLEPLGGMDQSLQAEATASGPGTRLHVARKAEIAAEWKLRDQFLRLKIAPGLTLADAAKKDPRINQGVDRAMLQAHTYQVQYHADGSVVVRVNLNLRAAWGELESPAGD